MTTASLLRPSEIVLDSYVIYVHNTKLIFNVTFKITLRNFMETIIRSERDAAPLELFRRHFYAFGVSMLEYPHAMVIAFGV